MTCPITALLLPGIFNFVIVLVTPIAFQQIQYHTYTVFAVMNFLILVCTYFLFPETAGRSLEEMSAIFEKSSKYNPYDVVRQEKRTPRRYDRQGMLIEEPGAIEHGFGNEDKATAESKEAPAATRTASASSASTP